MARILALDPGRTNIVITSEKESWKESSSTNFAIYVVFDHVLHYSIDHSYIDTDVFFGIHILYSLLEG